MRFLVDVPIQELARKIAQDPEQTETFIAALAQALLKQHNGVVNVGKAVRLNTPYGRAVFSELIEKSGGLY